MVTVVLLRGFSISLSHVRHLASTTEATDLGFPIWTYFLLPLTLLSSRAPLQPDISPIQNRWPGGSGASCPADPACSGARHLRPPHRRDIPAGIEPLRVSLPPTPSAQSGR